VACPLQTPAYFEKRHFLHMHENSLHATPAMLLLFIIIIVMIINVDVALSLAQNAAGPPNKH